MSLPGMPSCFLCRRAQLLGSEPLEQLVCMAGIVLGLFSIKSRFNWLDKVAGDSLPYQAGCHPG